MRPQLIFVLLITVLITSCAKSPFGADSDKQINSSYDSFMPLQIGNYWKFNEENYSRIKDTVRINGNLYYEIYSLIGGDASGTNYYRIDADQNLISGSIKDPKFQYTMAKFNAKAGDTFQTIGDQTVNDYKVTVIEKTDTRMTFSYDMIYHPNLKGNPHTTTFVRGKGWEDGWKTIKIGNKVYNN